MPSGVSHGAALLSPLGMEAGAKAMSAKFGIRLIQLASVVMAGLFPAIHVFLRRQ
jgi:hypothetical protein